MVVNTYGISVGIEKIGWKLYLVYIGWICVELVIIYFVSFFFSFLFVFLGGLRLGLFTRILLPLPRTRREQQQTGFPEMILMLILFFLAVLCGNGRENVGRTQADFRGAESPQGIYSKD